jgi:hypothetical protein
MEYRETYKFIETLNGLWQGEPSRDRQTYALTASDDHKSAVQNLSNPQVVRV